MVTHLLTRGKKTPTATPEPACDIRPNITPHVRPRSDQPSPHPSRAEGEIRIYILDGMQVRRLKGPHGSATSCESALSPPRQTWAERSLRAHLAAASGGEGARLHRCRRTAQAMPACSSVLHRVCAAVLAQHPTHGERWQLTGCLEGGRTLAWPCRPCATRPRWACDSRALRHTGSASRVFVTEPPQLDGRSQVAAAPARRREGNDGLLAVGGGLASVVAAVLSSCLGTRWSASMAGRRKLMGARCWHQARSHP